MLYENAYPSNYEEFKTWYEVSYRDVLEMDALWQAMGGQLDGIQNAILTVISAMFIKYADEYAISLWEEFLWIEYDGHRELEERKKMVLSFFLDNGHIGEPEIRELLSVFTSAPCSMRLNGGSLWLRIQRRIGETFHLSDFYFILAIKLPAHLGLYTWVELPVDNQVYLGSTVTLFKEEVLNHPDDLKLNPNRDFDSAAYMAGATTSFHLSALNHPDDLSMNGDRSFNVSLHHAAAMYRGKEEVLNTPDMLVTGSGGNVSGGLQHGSAITKYKEEKIL